MKPGQLLTGRDELSADSGIAPSTVERILNYLENEHQIEQHKTNRFRLITIKNWERYQNSEQQNEQPMDNQRTTEGQKADTYKKDNNKKDENEKNNYLTPTTAFCMFGTMKTLATIILLSLTISPAYAVECTPPTDANTSIGTWRFKVGEDINQPIYGCRTRYDGQLVVLSAVGLPAGVTLVQVGSDTNLPATVYFDSNDPQYVKMVNPMVGRAYIRGKLAKPIMDTSITIANGIHSESLIIGTVEDEPGISGGCK